jgi:hypothetical protein
MYLRVKGDLFTTHVVYELGRIIDHGVLHFGAMKYSKDEGIVSLPIVRYKMRAVKKMLFWTAYKYDFAVRIPALVVIRNVMSCVVENNFNDPTIQDARLWSWGFFVDFEERLVSIGSIQEVEGKTCYSVNLKVSEIDIEIRDQQERIQ